MLQKIEFDDFIHNVLGLPEGFFLQDLAKPPLPPRSKAQEMLLLPENTTSDEIKRAFAAKLRGKLFRVSAYCLLLICGGCAACVQSADRRGCCR